MLEPAYAHSWSHVCNDNLGTSFVSTKELQDVREVHGVRDVHCERGADY